MSSPYRLLLLEDDKAFAGSLYQVLNKQNLYSKPIEIRSFSYDEYEQQFDEHRNSTREIIVLGGRESLGYEPDANLLKLILTQQERTHVYVMVPSLVSQNVLQLWHPGVSGIVERNAAAKPWLAMALQRLQVKQQPRTTSGRSNSSFSSKSDGFFAQMRAAVFSFFM